MRLFVFTLGRKRHMTVVLKRRTQMSFTSREVRLDEISIATYIFQLSYHLVRYLVGKSGTR